MMPIPRRHLTCLRHLRHMTPGHLMASLLGLSPHCTGSKSFPQLALHLHVGNIAHVHHGRGHHRCNMSRDFGCYFRVVDLLTPLGLVQETNSKRERPSQITYNIACASTGENRMDLPSQRSSSKKWQQRKFSTRESQLGHRSDTLQPPLDLDYQDP